MERQARHGPAEGISELTARRVEKRSTDLARRLEAKPWPLGHLALAPGTPPPRLTMGHGPLNCFRGKTFWNFIFGSGFVVATVIRNIRASRTALTRKLSRIPSACFFLAYGA